MKARMATKHAGPRSPATEKGERAVGNNSRERVNACSPSLTGLHVESDEGDGHHGGKDAAHGLARHDVPRVRRREAAGDAKKRALR